MIHYSCVLRTCTCNLFPMPAVDRGSFVTALIHCNAPKAGLAEFCLVECDNEL